MTRLSHLLFKVEDLHYAVKKLTHAGFIVEYGKTPEKAYNAMIWLEEEVFVEIYQNNGLSSFIKLFMKLAGYKSILQRMNKWDQKRHGWCEWSIESADKDLKKEEDIFKQLKKPFTTHFGKRTSIQNQKLTWHLIFPKDIAQPFVMSAYLPDPRPKIINHPNGITAVDYAVVGEDALDMDLLKALNLDKSRLRFVKGSGIQSVVFKNSNVKIEDILN